MVYKKDSWIAAFKKAVEDLNTSKPTSGLPCAIASLRVIRDGVLADCKSKKFDEQTIKASFGEMIKEFSNAGAVSDGFLSNASAAAKAAGFKPDDSSAITKLTD